MRGVQRWAWLAIILLGTTTPLLAAEAPRASAPFARPIASPQEPTPARLLAEARTRFIDPVITLPGVAARAIIDARIFNIILVNRARSVRQPPSANTAQSIDAWTSTVLVGHPGGFGTSVDQWVAMAYMLGRI